MKASPTKSVGRAAKSYKTNALSCNECDGCVKCAEPINVFAWISKLQRNRVRRFKKPTKFDLRIDVMLTSTIMKVKGNIKNMKPREIDEKVEVEDRLVRTKKLLRQSLLKKKFRRIMALKNGC